VTQPRARKPPTQLPTWLESLLVLAQSWRDQAAFLDQTAAAELRAGKTADGKVTRERARTLLSCAVALGDRIRHEGGRIPPP
jgi:hypothetical protein